MEVSAYTNIFTKQGNEVGQGLAVTTRVKRSKSGDDWLTTTPPPCVWR